MSHNRVRIYELAKELNRENKELVRWCDRLNITVKSPSSTLNEFDADRVRLLAKKQTESEPSSQQQLVTQSTKNPVQSKSSKSDRPQVLGIEKSQPSDRSQSRAQSPVNRDLSEGETSDKATPTLVKPPTRPKPAATPAATRPEEKPRKVDKPVKKKSTVAPKSDRPQVEEAPKPKAQPPQAAAKPTPEPEPQTSGEALLPKPSLKTAKSKDVEAQAPTKTLLPKPSLKTAKTKDEAAQETPEKAESPQTETRLEAPKRPRRDKAGKARPSAEQERDTRAKAATKGKRSKSVEMKEEDWDEIEATTKVEAPVTVNPTFARPENQLASSEAKPTVKSAKRKSPGKPKQQTVGQERDRTPSVEPTRPDKLVVTGSMSVQELAAALAVPETEIVKILFFKGMAVNVTQSLDLSTINLIGEELEVAIETEEPEAEARKVNEILDVEDLEHLQPRPPVVTIMGHVDHGKTTLLDAIRQTKVAQGEAGGITQHIGAYHVDVEQEGRAQQVVFLDTPGHEAFTAMRARGTRVTDMAILVVAADDGVRPQTLEAIGHAKAAGVPIVVAINKVDKPEAQSDRVKQELAQQGLVPEEWGGETIMVPVSAIRQENLDTLLEMILLVAEVCDLQANPDRPAKGTVIEANLDKTRGAVATLLVQNGTLRVGDTLVAGSAFGKVRAAIGDRGQRVEAATPSFAVEVLGLSDVPAAGDEFLVFENEKQARAVAAANAEKQRESRLSQGRVSLATLSGRAQQGQLKDLNLIVKADVQGSLEAIVGALEQLPQQEVQLRLLFAAPGEIAETDVDLAAASDAVIVGFNTTFAPGAREAADAAGVDVREYSIIYKLLEDIQGAMEGLLEPELVEEPLGEAEVRAVFAIGRSKVAGCYIRSGKVIRNRNLRVHRGDEVVYEGVVDSLKRIKDDVKEVNAGYECGVGVDRFNDWQEGDRIEAYQMVTKRRTLALAS